MDRLTRLFNPRSIAVIGGGAWGAEVIRQCQKIGFAGDIWLVHPTKDDVAGLLPFREIADLPAPPDAVFIGVNRHTTVAAVEALAAIGAGGAICFASGFSEAAHEVADGHDLQQALLVAAGNMPVIGPNCYGFLNYLDGVTLWPDQHGGLRVDSGVALIAQSSNVAINLTMQTRGLPIAYVATVGNQAQTGLSEIGRTLLANPKVTALGLYLEGIDDLAGFVELAAAARRLGKPIVALKTGKSEQAQRAAISHTASLAGSDAGADTLFDRLGIGRVSSLSAFLETLKLLHVVGPLGEATVASMSCSGGEASLMADMAHGRSISFPPLSEAQTVDLRNTLGPIVALANPLDYHTFIWGNEDAMAATFSAMMSPDMALGVVILDFPRPDRCTAPAWDLVLNAVECAQAQTGRPIAVLSSLVENLPEHVAIDLVARGILPLCGMAEAIEAIAVAARVGKPKGEGLFVPPLVRPAQVLSEAEAKQVLKRYGLPVPQSEYVTNIKGLADAGQVVGFPVVLKGTGVAHKTEAGAVVVGIADQAALLRAAEAMPTETFLVEQMITDVIVELLVGVVLDPAHGYVLTLAAGGTWAEILEDRTSLILPVDASDIKQALGELRIAPVLNGYRGAPAVDIQAIIDAVLAVQSYVMTQTPIEIEINPLMCGPRGAVAADALITTGERHD
ncbi:acyl-CoA synthetase (NDP forming) [Loktanella sp. PT4BL]|jgi:acyl-CoA synthetase (NDP forming)|uniref:acetate--CoA ligase family protein n=1 Tax=Loktanella sp. PT4BL TaxID=2135611 RepID=UPI000D76607A|nr:acetate--CoA ligase family protein [Loktanella sp. PT4BL]PXW72467.1 acyl-CoA synthetase (NDP forming) [Loktanella sp. PT4BL]